MSQVKAKILSLFMCFVILTIPSHTLAQQGGRVTDLQEGNPAPYSGILLDTAASARLLTEKEYQDEDCALHDAVRPP